MLGRIDIQLVENFENLTRHRMDIHDLLYLITEERYAEDMFVFVCRLDF
jgi:hypothetical protein